MTKITHSVRFFLKNEQEGGQFLDSPSHLFFVPVLGGSAVEKPPLPALLRSAFCLVCCDTIATSKPPLPVVFRRAFSFPCPQRFSR